MGVAQIGAQSKFAVRKVALGSNRVRYFFDVPCIRRALREILHGASFSSKFIYKFQSIVVGAPGLEPRTL